MEKIDKTNPEKKHPILRRTAKVIGYTSCGLLLIGCAVGVHYIENQTKNLSPISYQDLTSEASSNMYAKDGTLIWSSATNKRVYAKYQDLPKVYTDLLVDIEDKDFYKHEGLSPKGILNAGVSYAKSKINGTQARGGSTIEQQLIKLTKFSTDASDQTIQRKVKEMFLASQLFKNYSREQILEFYANKINMGEHSYGAQTIARTYFGKTLKELSISQLAIIAGLGQAPSTYNLYDNPKAVEKRRNTILYVGLSCKSISKEDYDKAIKTPVTEGLKPRNWDSVQTQEVTKQHNAYVNSTLAQIESMGYDLEKTPLQIKTNLNVADDNYLRDVFNNKKQYFQDDNQQAAMTVTDPKTGEVIAQLGGRYDYNLAGFNRATQTNRSSGSSIKPVLNYSTAIEYGNWATNKVLDDTPYHYAGTDVVALDYGGVTHGSATMQVALRNSYNTPAIRTLESVGLDKGTKALKNFGYSQTENLNLSNALGVDASTEEMASAFSVFSNGGTYHKPRYVSSLEFSDHSVKTIEDTKHQALRPSTAFTITSMLQGVPSSLGTMVNSDLSGQGIHAGAKTGTVGYDSSLGMGSLASDVWTVAYTKSVAFAVWEGYDKPNENGIDEIAIYNARQDMYKDLMTHFAQGKDNSDWVAPNTVKKLSGDKLTAQYVPTDATKEDVLKTDSNVSINMLDSKLYKSLNGKTGKVELSVPSVPQVPSGYVIGDWKTQLNNDKTQYIQDIDKKYDTSNIDTTGGTSNESN